MNIFNRKNTLKAIKFETPDFIPMIFAINPACWHHYDQEVLKDLMEDHKLLFSGYVRPEGKVVPHYGLDQLKDAPYTDYWGCVWETLDDGITGSVHTHPLESWDNFENYKAPNPEKSNGMFPINWDETKKQIAESKNNNVFTWAGLPHGHTFLRLQDIRGYVNLIMDMADENPQLDKLIKLISDFNYELICKWIETSPDMLDFPEDLGMQVGPMLSPDHFRKYIKPVYQRVMKLARDKEIIVHMHSDGDIRDLVDDLIDGGVEVINLQDLVNGIDWIQNKFAGKVCVNLDIDRQKITPYGTPEQIDSMIREEVEKLGSKKGGLVMIYGMYPGIPLENAKALMDAMEKYIGFDGIHPIQPQCMDIKETKKEFGDRACVLGNIDCSFLLVFDSPEETRQSVKETIAAAAPGGGYILSSSNSIHPGCKPENYLAMVEAARKYGKYPELADI